ncbi:MAG: family 16 glycosylhydrolase, partial [Bacteroidota bacterium]
MKQKQKSTYMLFTRNFIILLIASLVSSVATAQNQPSFNPGQDPAPSGKTWEKVENMSDEFNDNSFNTQKWDDLFLPYWKGRAPGLFTRDAVTEANGNLRITVDFLSQQEINQNPGFKYQGGIVVSKNKLTGNDKYGYYECSFKGNKTFMSTTFWLINQRFLESGCDKRVIELDVTETVGIVTPNAPNWATGFDIKMNSNTHSRDVPAGCNFPSGSIGNKANLGEKSWEGYHTYGVWWKSPTELLFYLDGQFQYQITPAAPFDIDMYLRMVVETYDWNPEGPGTNPNTGLRYDGVNDNFNNRTSYYDWVRTWKLVDCNNNCGGTAGVDCNSLPTSLTTSSSITVPVDYTADQQRDVVVELWNSGWLGEGRVTVGAGSGTANVTINLNNAPAAGSNYQLKASIRPVGTNWTQNINACTKSGVSLTNAGGPPDVDCNSLPNSLTSATSIPVTVSYTADQQRDVVIELWNSGWLGQGTTTVNAGTGTATVTINLNSVPASGNYQLKASIRPVGAGWQQNLDACTKSNVNVNNGAGPPDVDCSSLPNSITSSTSIPVSVSYTSDQQRDIVIELWNGGWLGQGTTTVNAGSGTATVTVNLNSAPAAGGNYQLKASIRPVGAGWQQNIDACTKSGVNVSSSNRQGINSEPSVRLFPNPVNRNASFSIELGNVEGVSEVSIFDQM